ncbi:MAG TPA: extracellular solute-binding protein [Acidothermaceae bacterium]
MITRRQFISATGLGAAALAATPLLDACSSSASKAASATTSSAATSASAASSSASAPSAVASAAASSAVASSAAASAPTGSLAASNITGHVSCAFFGAADIVKAWTPIFADFQKSYPGITLEVVPVNATDWTSYADSVILQMAGGKIFDVVQAPVNIQQLFAGKNVLLPLDDFLARDKAEMASYYQDENANFFKWTTDIVSPKGTPTYFLPADYNTQLCWINTKMFQDAGVPIPTNDWTWDDLMAAGKKICTKPGTYLIDVVPNSFAFGPWAYTNGGTLLNADWTKSTMTDPKTVEGVVFAQNLCKLGYSPKPGGAFDDVTEFSQDKLAIFGAGMWLNPSLKTAGAAGKAKVVAWPHKTQQGTSVGWNAYPLVKKSQNQEAAWAFSKYLVSQRAVTNLAATGQACPGLKSVFFSDTLATACPEPGISELWNSVAYATPLPSPVASDAVTDAFAKTLTEVLSSSSDPMPLLTALDKQLNTLLAGGSSSGG